MSASGGPKVIQRISDHHPIGLWGLGAAAKSGAMFSSLLVAILVGAGLRFYRLGGNSLWVDEFATLRLATQSPAEILRMSSSVNFIPPLYFLLVHGALRVLGDSEFALRFLSAVAGTCTIPVIWLLTREITSSHSTAYITAALLALNPLHLWYSQEARPYALMLLFGCAALLSLERAVRTNSLRYWIIFTVCSALAFLTHTTGVMFALIAWIWVLWSPDRRQLVSPLVVASLAAGLLCTPFAVAIVRALASTRGTFHSPPRSLSGLEIPYNLLTYIGGYSFGPAPREIQNLGGLPALRGHPFQGAVGAVALFTGLVISWLNRRSTMAPFIVLLVIPLAGILALSALSGKAYNVRYTLPGAVGFLGILGVAVHAIQLRRPRAVVLALFGGLSLWADAQWFWVPRYWKEDSRAAAVWLRDRLPARATVAVAPSYDITPLAYYTRQAGAELRFVPASVRLDSASDGLPRALVLTRLHHVPNWRALKASFMYLGGVQLEQGQVAGYEMLIRPELRNQNSH
jgi:mannosyltransferase